MENLSPLRKRRTYPAGAILPRGGINSQSAVSVGMNSIKVSNKWNRYCPDLIFLPRFISHSALLLRCPFILCQLGKHLRVADVPCLDIGAQAPPQGIFGVPLQTSIRYANVAISLLDAEGNSYIYGYIPIVVAKCGVFLKEKGKIHCMYQWIIC
jgi:hypothetical protein